MAAIDFPNSPALNDEFTAGTSVYVWNGTTWNFKQSTLPSSSLSDSNPIMNGSATAGTSGLASRYDHVHPSDTSRASVLELSSHSSATTSVHGITNTADLVYTSDSRLSDARTPTAHAASHGSAGSDAITVAQSQVTNLTNDLFNKEPSITSGTTSQYWRGDKSWQTLDKASVGLSNVENTAISTWAGSSSIVTVGTISSGIWEGTDIGLANGGTNATLTAVDGGVVYSTSSALAITSVGLPGQVLTSNGTSAPTWQNASGGGGLDPFLLAGM